MSEALRNTEIFNQQWTSSGLGWITALPCASVCSPRPHTPGGKPALLPWRCSRAQGGRHGDWNSPLSFHNGPRHFQKWILQRMGETYAQTLDGDTSTCWSNAQQLATDWLCLQNHGISWAIGHPWVYDLLLLSFFLLPTGQSGRRWEGERREGKFQPANDLWAKITEVWIYHGILNNL